MAKNIDLTSQEWIDIIFEGKNKSFGAYKLRQQSSKRHAIAFGFTMILVAVVYLSATLAKNVQENIQRDRYETSIELVDLTPPEPLPEEVTKPQYEVPPPMDIISTVRFTVPTIKRDDEVAVNQEIKSQTELTETDIRISLQDVKGTDEEFGIDIATLKDNKVIVQDKTPIRDEIVDIPETQASFPGGESAMYEFLRNKIVYPTIPQENNIQGKVTLQFVVDKDGVITNIQVVKSVDKYLDAEAVRVVKSMPRWIPGKQGGISVKVRFTLPVQFKLQ